MQKIKNILISTGPTRVYLDPVRFISNKSSGKMGLAFVNACLAKGANVRVVSGCVDVEYPKNEKLSIFNVETNEEMLFALEKKFDWADVFISIAAVVDFEPTIVFENKIKKTKEKFCLQLKNSVDILKTLALKKKPNQIVVGFALETEDLLTNASKKMKDKKLDFIVANEMSESMGLATASATLIARDGSVEKFKKMTKNRLAEQLLNSIFSRTCGK